MGVGEARGVVPCSLLSVPVFHPVLWAFRLFQTVACSQPQHHCSALKHSRSRASLQAQAGRGLLPTAGPARVQLVLRGHEGVSGLCLTGKTLPLTGHPFRPAESGSPGLLPEMSTQATGSDSSHQAGLRGPSLLPSYPCPVSPCWSQQSQQHLSSHCDARRS